MRKPSRGHRRFLTVILVAEIVIFSALFVAFDKISDLGGWLWSWLAETWGDFLVALSGGMKY